ncbi:MAG: hypothetical protein LKH93_19930, partial [Clostridium beijerinckii]|nr:hypothetical protein [Clostridium beijerinckii]
ILKVSDKSDSKLLNRNTLYTRTNSIFKNNGIPKISLIDLYHSRQYDFLFELSKQKEKITYDDIKRILTIFGDDVTTAKAQSLKERFTVMYECWNDF